MSSTGRFGRLTDAPATLLIFGARLIDPAAGRDATGDLAIVGGRLADPAALPADAERLDGRGLVVAPGFVDLHAHLREPGGEAAETVETGTRAAARGGFTALCAMPNTDPPLDGAAGVEGLAARAVGAACRVLAIGAVTLGRSGETLADMGGLARAGAVGVSDDGASVPDALARQAANAAARQGLLLVEHAEDASHAGGGVMRAGAAATRLGLRGWPPEAEARIVERDVELAAETGARLHLTHLSTAASVAAVTRAKERSLPVTADVTPHHLALSDEWVAGSRRFAWDDGDVVSGTTERAYDGACRVNPPLASRADARALMRALRDGVIDAIATDHAPHPAERKLVPFGEAAPGLIGLETALSIGLAAVRAGALELTRLLEALSSAPARIIGLERGLSIGAPADLVAFDSEAAWRVERATLASRSANTPLLGMELPGVVRLTVAGGRVTYRS